MARCTGPCPALPPPTSNPSAGCGPFPYEFFSPINPSLRWIVCSTASRRAISRPASTALSFSRWRERTFPSTLFHQPLPTGDGTVCTLRLTPSSRGVPLAQLRDSRVIDERLPASPTGPPASAASVSHARVRQYAVHEHVHYAAQNAARRAAKDDDIGVLARLKTADAVGDAEDLRRVNGYRLQRVILRKPIRRCEYRVEQQPLAGDRLVVGVVAARKAADCDFHA